MKKRPLLIVAGEASGDLHGARLLSHLRVLRQDVEAFGLGGEQLAAAGLDRIADAAEISVVGISEVLGILARAREIFAALLAEVDRRGAKSAVLIDFPEFNLRMARALEERGVRVTYYISPQVWAWRKRRVHTIAKVVDRMLVLFPFEVDFYRRYGIEAVHVGHPLVDEVPRLPQVWDQRTRDGPYRIALLPGSRESEVQRILPILLQSAQLIAGQLAVRFSLIKAPSIAEASFAAVRELPGLTLDMIREERFAAIAESHLALCASGTATLEVGLLGTPLIVVYRVARLSEVLGRVLLRLPHKSLVNLILNKRAVPELLQQQARPERIAKSACELLRSPARLETMRSDLALLRPALGRPGASLRAAEEIARWLPTSSNERPIG